jgi:hypothetical protein
LQQKNLPDNTVLAEEYITRARKLAVDDEQLSALDELTK